MNKKKIIGLTGGIACGKDTVAEMFHEYGAHIINADQVVHQLLRDNSSVKSEIISTFGANILDDREEISRPKLGKIVFGNPDLLGKLNEIIHPRVVKLINEEAKENLLLEENSAVILNVPLLIETNLTCMVDSVVLVFADEEVQIKRLAQRGFSKEDALKRIKSQMPSSEKAKFADFIIYNNGSLSDTAKQVKKIWKAICQESRKI